MASLTRIPAPSRSANLLFLIILCLSTVVTAQVNISGKTYPFNLDYLAYCSTQVQQNHTVTPVYRNGTFVYLNHRTGQPLFNKKFQEAYPFVRGYGLVKVNGLYGIINTKGVYLIKPLFSEFKLDERVSRDDGPWIVFGDHTVFGFDGKLSTELPYVENKILMPPFYSIKKGNKVALYSHYGSKRQEFSDKLLLLCDSVLGTTYYQAIIMKGGKIGAVDTNGETVVPFDYTAYAANPDSYPGLYGFPSSYYNYMPIHFALCKGQEWCYYHEAKFLFKSHIKALEYNFNYFRYEQTGLFNYMNSEGEPVLKRNYQWLYGNSLALTTDNRLVLLLNDGKEVFYYQTPVDR